MRLVILIITTVLSFVSCKQNDHGKAKSEPQDTISVAAKVEINEYEIDECNVNDSLRIRFEHFNNKLIPDIV